MDSSSQFVARLPRNYDAILGPFFFAPYARDMAARVAATDPRRVLEVACGTGILTERLRASLDRRTELVATDLNAPMIAHARGKLGDQGIAWREADAPICHSPTAASTPSSASSATCSFPTRLTAFVTRRAC